jgi:cytochrome c
MSRSVNIAATVAAAAGAVLLKLTVAVPAGAEDEGRVAFNNYCRICHSIKKGENRLGPSLYGIMGAKAAAVPGYANYSESLRGSGITWDEATLDLWIENPEALVPNNSMKPYTGITDAAVRKEIIEFLKSNREGA